MPASGTALQSSKGGIASELGEGPRGPARFKGTAAELWALQVPRCRGQAGGHHHPAGVGSRCQGCCEIHSSTPRSGVQQAWG